MAKRIYKFIIPHEGICTIMMPEGSRVLSFGPQRGAPTIWALIDTDKGPAERVFNLVATGEDLPFLNEDESKGTFIGTAMFQTGTFVFHLFELH